MFVGTTNEMTFLEMAYVLSLHNALVMLVHAGQPPHEGPGNKTPTQSFLVLLPWILWANCISQERIVSQFAWMVHRLVSLNKPMRYASAASCRASMVIPWNHMSDLKPWAISQTSLCKVSLEMRSSVIFWNQQISLSATVPGLSWGGHGMASV